MPYIAAGKFKRTAITTPTKGDVRPTQRFLRLGVFDFLGDFVKDAVVLDLFAGSGAFGIEAISRGAHKVVFVDISAYSVLTIKENVQKLGIPELAVTYEMDALDFLAKSIRKHRGFDIIFIDPPYAKLWSLKPEQRDSYLLELMYRAQQLLRPKSLVIMKHPKKLPIQIPTGLEAIEVRRYGLNTVTYLAQKEYIIKGEEIENAT